MKKYTWLKPRSNSRMTLIERAKTEPLWTKSTLGSYENKIL